MQKTLWVVMASSTAGAKSRAAELIIRNLPPGEREAAHRKRHEIAAKLEAVTLAEFNRDRAPRIPAPRVVCSKCRTAVGPRKAILHVGGQGSRCACGGYRVRMAQKAVAVT